MIRLVIPLRGPARSSAALHDGLLRTLLFCNHAYWPIIHSRSSCSLIWNATTSTLSISAANSTVCVFFGHPVTFGLMSTFLSLVCPARIWSTCLPCFVFPAFGSMVGAHAESTASSIQCPKVRQSPSPSTPLYSSHLHPFFTINIVDLVSVHRVMSQSHIYDATEIFRTLPQHKKESFIKLGFYLISFFYYLYRYIRALL